MHDIKAIRADPEAFDAGLRRRGLEAQSKPILAIDSNAREIQTNLETWLAERNDAARKIGQAKTAGYDDIIPNLMDKVATLKQLAETYQDQAPRQRQIVNDLLGRLPNLPAPGVPDGFDETGNVLIHIRGTKATFTFTPLEHDTLALRFGYDPDAAARIAGARFAVLKGPLARLHRALGQYMIDVHTAEHGYTEVAPPLLVRSEALFGVGQLPKFEDDVFKTTDQPPRYLIPTAEASLTNLVCEQIVDIATLPLRFTALTPCFRSEAGSAGRDTRGLIRQHQFDKVELVSITTPEQAADEHERMTVCAETILDRLQLPYRRMLLCAGDMGFAARKTYDLEVWLPGQGQYREISSCSDCGDFQARRMDTRYRAKGEKGTRGFVHTLNGSALAVGRTLVAVLENYQRADGSVHVPDVLHPYMGGVTELRPNG